MSDEECWVGIGRLGEESGWLVRDEEGSREGLRELGRDQNRVSIRKTFAQFLQNETQNFSFFAHLFCANKQLFAQSFAKVISRKIALYRFCETQVLRNSATRVLRNSAMS